MFECLPGKLAGCHMIALSMGYRRSLVGVRGKVMQFGNTFVRALRHEMPPVGLDARWGSEVIPRAFPVRRIRTDALVFGDYRYTCCNRSSITPAVEP